MSEQDLKQQWLAIDHGYCNPMKVKFAAEDEGDIREELEKRGYSDDEIKSMTRGWDE